MPALQNAQHEAFAQALAKGSTKTQALLSVGYSDTDTASSRASQIWARPEVQARYAELRQEMLDANKAMQADDAEPSPGDVTRQWMIAEYKKNIAAAREAGKPGDANRALEAIGRLLGYFDDPKPPAEEQKPGTVPGATAPVPAFDPSAFASFDPSKLVAADDEGDDD